MGRETRVAMAGLAMCLAAGGVFAGEAPLPRPENATLVLPKGMERTVYPAASRLGDALDLVRRAPAPAHQAFDVGARPEKP